MKRTHQVSQQIRKDDRLQFPAVAGVYCLPWSILPGIEPGISCSVGKRLIHWATGPTVAIPCSVFLLANIVILSAKVTI